MTKKEMLVIVAIVGLIIGVIVTTCGCEEPNLYQGNIKDLAQSTVYFKDWKGNCFASVATKGTAQSQGAVSITLVPAPNCEGDLRAPPPRRER